MRKPTPTQYLFRRKAIIKTITWRVVSVGIGFGMSIAFGFSSKEASIFTLLFNGVAMIAYYIHELIWRYLKWRKKYGSKVLSK